MLEAIGFSLLLVLAIRPKGLSDRVKIETIFERSKVWVTSESGAIKKCVFLRESFVPGGSGKEYVYRLPLGMPYKKLRYLNENIGVFKDGLNKNVELEFKNGKLFVYVFEDDLPTKIDFKDLIK